MTNSSTVSPHDFWRWLLHECVRANPLYVISALLLAYAVMQLNSEIDPQTGKAGGAIAVIALLQVYELAVLAVAAVVMIKRPGGGRDMHGLTIVAAIFLSGTFIELDELANSFPAWRFALLGGALALAAFKLECYARLPGVLLPLRYRAAMLATMGVHALPALMAKCDALDARACALQQGLAWSAGWLSLLPLAWLAWRDGARESAAAEPKDPLATRVCAGTAVAIVAAISCVHLISGDWVADRSFDTRRLLPQASVMLAATIILRWRRSKKLGQWASALALMPLVILFSNSSEIRSNFASFDAATYLNASSQACAAALVFYIALGLGTGLKHFYAVPAFAVLGAFGEWLAKFRASIPFFRTIMAAGAGFALLLVGMLVSLYRERFIARIGHGNEAAKAESIEPPVTLSE